MGWNGEGGRTWVVSVLKVYEFLDICGHTSRNSAVPLRIAAVYMRPPFDGNIRTVSKIEGVSEYMAHYVRNLMSLLHTLG